MSSVINVGLIGFGLAGRVFHAPIITNVEGLKLTKIFERNPNNIEIISKRYPEVVVVQDLFDIFNDENIDLIVVATVNHMHYELAKSALNLGKHVIVEKPFTITSEEADELIEISRKNNKVLSVHQNRRYDSDFKTVKKVIESGLLGDIVEYEAHFDRFRTTIKETSWREKEGIGSGLLYDIGSHLIDQAQCIFGMPNEITADLRIQREQCSTIDNFEVIFSYPKTKVTLKCGMLVKELGPHFIIQGNRGSFIKYGMDIQEEALNKGITPADIDKWGEEPEKLWGTINTEYKGVNFRGTIKSETGDYREFYRNIRETILGNEELEVLPSQARNTIKLIEIAIKSSEEKKTIVL